MKGGISAQNSQKLGLVDPSGILKTPWARQSALTTGSLTTLEHVGLSLRISFAGVLFPIFFKGLSFILKRNTNKFQNLNFFFCNTEFLLSSQP